LVADRFLRWAIKTRLVRPDLNMQCHRRGTSPRMSATDQEHAVERVVHTDELTPRDRAAAILVLVFGQQIEDVVGLTWGDVNITDDLVRIRVGSIEIALRDPLDGPWRELAARPGNDLTAAHPSRNWVFRGYPPAAASTPVTSATDFVRSSAHEPRDLARCTSSPNSPQLRSWPRRSDITRRPSNAIPSTQRLHTADTSLLSGAVDPHTCHAPQVERVLNMSADELAAERPDTASEDVHFTQALVREVVDLYSSVGDVVLGPFAGYGTTLVVSHQMGRKPIGVELLPERAALIRQRLDSSGVVIEGDARQLDRFEIGPVDLCLTSPPYMSAVDHPQNPLTGYATLDGDYSTYLDELLSVFLAVKDCLRNGGYLVINAANIRTGDVVTPLAWDIAHALRPHLAFRRETYLRWDHPLDFISGDYCLVFQKTN